MALSAREADPGVMAEINITPFTDVLLVLLIIFMILAAISTPPGFQKSLQKGRSPLPPQHQIPIIIEVAADARVTVDGFAAAAPDLYRAIAVAVERHKADPKRFSAHINLLGAPNAQYNTIIRVLDAARLAGDDDVGLVIR